MLGGRDRLHSSSVRRIVVGRVSARLVDDPHDAQDRARADAPHVLQTLRGDARQAPLERPQRSLPMQKHHRVAPLEEVLRARGAAAAAGEVIDEPHRRALQRRGGAPRGHEHDRAVADAVAPGAIPVMNAKRGRLAARLVQTGGGRRRGEKGVRRLLGVDARRRAGRRGVAITHVSRCVRRGTKWRERRVTTHSHARLAVKSLTTGDVSRLSGRRSAGV